ncbi:zf-HC2 domain-containing protein [Allokutzneria sp. A3M-2-11 16]|uniref:anti-sigma factor family protein n=1 Tax=Allokutzneria sp. A3M-2-11 16 TaxID=2962043 RepID=UPI0020B7BC83|nr:zf-HC2 domain-containing protein [Allokutzneria sp. A3M-2-11 16]MCP3801502.1 zf-HC2 domain-containing protein [Allokutzneria sp. A3M-2-11 16]
MRPLVEHTDLGAYVLCALSPEECEAFEAHLMDCAECQRELKSFADLPDLLDQLTPSRDNVLTGLLDRVATERRKRKRNWLVAAAAAVVLIVVGPVVTWSALTSDPWSPWTTTSALSARKGEVWANLKVDGVPWGTGVRLELGGITGPLTCGLYAVTRSGETRAMMDWMVPPYGYGVPSQPKPLVASGMVALKPADIARYVVRTSDGRDLVILEP